MDNTHYSLTYPCSLRPFEQGCNTTTVENNTVTLANIFASAFNDKNEFEISLLPKEIQEAIKKLEGKSARNAGFMNFDGNVTISDAAKAKSFIEQAFKDAADNDDEDEDDDDSDSENFRREVKAWNKSNTTITEAPRGDDVPMLVRDVVIRRSRADRTKIYGIGLRGVDANGKGIKLSLNINYFNTVMGLEKTATPDSAEILVWCEKNFRSKWVVLGTTISRAGETGYYTSITKLTDLEKAALEKIGKERVKRNNAGEYGFIHAMDGIRYNLAGTCDESESAEYQTMLEAYQRTALLRREESEKGKGIQEGLAYSMHAKLQQLILMLDAKLISRKEYDSMRESLLFKGM